MNWFNQVDAIYRSDLRELNELNFARFDAKLEQRIAEIRADVRTETGKLEHRITELRAELRQEIGGLESRVKTELATLRADMVKWLFGMWITLLGAMVALAKL